MKYYGYWTLVLVLSFASLNSWADKNHSYSIIEIKILLKSLASKKALCLQKKCKDLKTYIEFENVLKSFEDLKELTEVKLQENRFLKNELAIQSKPFRQLASQNTAQSCYKKALLNELLLNEGIDKNGSVLFPKKAVGGGGAVCWANSRKKKEATITLCEFPLAINIQTKGGGEAKTVTRSREYLFQINGCDLLAVHTTDESQTDKKETSLTYTTCIQSWNKRTADANMSGAEVQLMEDTIGYCFREHLLPPLNAKAGRINPPIVEGPGPEAHK